MPVLQVWEETPGGAVERVRLVGASDFTVATEREARAHGLTLARHWLMSGSDRTTYVCRAEPD